MEEGGAKPDSAKDTLRNEWKKLVESEERLRFWKQMVRWDLCVRELEHLGDDIKNKFRSDSMKGGSSEKEVVRICMKLKLKDERRHQRELKERRNKRRKELEREIDSPRKFKKIASQLNVEAAKWRKLERRKYTDKATHLKKIREEEEEKALLKCPEEIISYKDVIVFNKKEMEKLNKELVEVSMIGDVELDDDERALLRLPPKFATRRRLDTLDMRTDFEMGAAKLRYQIHKEDTFKEISEEDELENKCKRRKHLDDDERKDMEKMDAIEAEGRRV